MSWFSGGDTSEDGGGSSFLGGMMSAASNLAKLAEAKAEKLLSFEEERRKFVNSKNATGREAAVPPWVGAEHEDELKSQILKLSTDKRNFTRDPPRGAIAVAFNYEDVQPVAMAILQEDPELEKLRFLLVPKTVTENTFWRNYFYRVSLISKSRGHHAGEAATQHQHQHQQEEKEEGEIDENEFASEGQFEAGNMDAASGHVDLAALDVGGEVASQFETEQAQRKAERKREAAAAAARKQKKEQAAAKRKAAAEARKVKAAAAKKKNAEAAMGKEQAEAKKSKKAEAAAVVKEKAVEEEATPEPAIVKEKAVEEEATPEPAIVKEKAVEEEATPEPATVEVAEEMKVDAAATNPEPEPAEKPRPAPIAATDAAEVKGADNNGGDASDLDDWEKELAAELGDFELCDAGSEPEVDMQGADWEDMANEMLEDGVDS